MVATLGTKMEPNSTDLNFAGHLKLKGHPDKWFFIVTNLSSAILINYKISRWTSMTKMYSNTFCEPRQNFSAHTLHSWLQNCKEEITMGAKKCSTSKWKTHDIAERMNSPMHRKGNWGSENWWVLHPGHQRGARARTSSFGPFYHCSLIFSLDTSPSYHYGTFL
jgi:hypothetical protein